MGIWLMELRHLRYFIAVAEELNFTRAAERLGINQPPLSVQIKQLEKELGTQLLRRRTRGIELTDAGKLLLEEARVILKQVESAKTGVQRRARGETGQLIVASGVAIYLHPLIPAIIREYGLKYPDVVVAPQTNYSALLTARLRAGKVDIAFIWRPVGDSDGLAIEPLEDEDLVVVLPAGHRLSNSASVPLATLAEERFILFPRDLAPDPYDSLIAACRRAGFSPALGQEAPEIVSAIPLVAAGLGISIVPRSTSQIMADGVSYVPIEGDTPRVGICLAHRQHDRSPAVQNFVAIARRSIRTVLGQPRGGTQKPL